MIVLWTTWLAGMVPALAAGGTWMGAQWHRYRKNGEKYQGDLDITFAFAGYSILVLFFVAIWPLAFLILIFARRGLHSKTRQAETERRLAEADTEIARLKKEGEL